MKAAFAAALFVLMLLLPQTARALCVSPLCSCSVTTTSLAFGTHQPLSGSATDSVGSVRVACGGVAGLLIPYTVGLSAGGSGNVAARRMSSGAHTLGYALYSDAGRTTPWGDVSGGLLLSSSILLDVLGLAPVSTHSVYGRIPAGQTTTVPGVYSDTLTVTLTYY